MVRSAHLNHILAVCSRIADKSEYWVGDDACSYRFAVATINHTQAAVYFSWAWVDKWHWSSREIQTISWLGLGLTLASRNPRNPPGATTEQSTVKAGSHFVLTIQSEIACSVWLRWSMLQKASHAWCLLFVDDCMGMDMGQCFTAIIMTVHACN